MKAPLTLTLLLALASPVFAAPVVVTSPGGNLKVTITDGERLAYEVSESGAAVLASSPLGITADGADLGEAAKLGEVALRQIDETYPVLGHHTTARNRAVEASIPVTSHGKTYTLQVRAQDDGVGVRYVL